jgi:hypothetical protein
VLLAEVSGSVTIAVAAITGLAGLLSGLGAAYLSNKSTRIQHDADLRQRSREWLRDQRINAYAAIAPAINGAITLAEELAELGLGTPESWVEPYKRKQHELLEARQKLRQCFSTVTLVAPKGLRAASRTLRESALGYIDHTAGLPTSEPLVTLALLKTQTTEFGDALADDIDSLGSVDE